MEYHARLDFELGVSAQALGRAAAGPARWKTDGDRIPAVVSPIAFQSGTANTVLLREANLASLDARVDRLCGSERRFLADFLHLVGTCRCLADESEPSRRPVVAANTTCHFQQQRVRFFASGPPATWHVRDRWCAWCEISGTNPRSVPPAKHRGMDCRYVIALRISRAGGSRIRNGGQR